MQDLFNKFVLGNKYFCFSFKGLKTLYRGDNYFEISVNFENDKQEIFCKKIEVQLEPFCENEFKIMCIIKDNQTLVPHIEHCWFMIDKDRDVLIKETSQVILSRFENRFGLNIKSNN